MKYKNEIMEIISNIMNMDGLDESISVNENLQNVGTDSITFIKIVVEIENVFDIEFPDEKLIITQADTIEKLCEIVASFD